MGMSRPLLPLLLASLLAGQAPQTPLPATATPPPQAAPIIKVTTRIVQVNVVVHDKKGEPVTDLKKEDFTLYDKGQEQPIKLFSMETNKPMAEAMQPLPEGVVANREWSKAGSSGGRASTLPNAVTVILLDALNSRFQDQHAAREGLIKFLTQIQPGDQVALYSLGNGLKVLHDFTTDTASLLRAMERFKSGHSFMLDASTATDADTGNDSLDDILNGADDTITSFYQARRIETTLSALDTIAQHLSGMAGRKNLIWLSGGFPLFVGQNADGSLSKDYQSFTEQKQRTVQTLNTVGIAIYPVDARGLMGVADTMPSMNASSRGPAMRGGRMQNPGQNRADQKAQQSILNTQATMHDIADRTGGRAFMNSNDIGGAIRKAITDTQVSYTLAYAPTHDQWNGEFREIKVKINRGGLDVRYRKGYYATPDNRDDPKIRQTTLIQAANSPLVSTGLGLLARVVEQPTAEKESAKINLVVESKDVDFVQNDKNQWAASLDVLLIVRDPQGASLHTLARTLNLGLTQVQYDTMQKTGIGVTFTVEAAPKATVLRAIVRDLGNGALGSLDVPLAATR